MSDVDTAPEAKLIERTWRWHFSDATLVDGSASYAASKPCSSHEVICQIVSSIPSMNITPPIGSKIIFNSSQVLEDRLQLIVTCSRKSNSCAGSFDSGT